MKRYDFVVSYEANGVWREDNFSFYAKSKKEAKVALAARLNDRSYTIVRQSYFLMS